jgi:hypothetical protein
MSNKSDKDVVMSVGKYELWNALFMTRDDAKTENTVELAKEIEKLMSKPGRVVICIRNEEE